MNKIAARSILVFLGLFASVAVIGAQAHPEMLVTPAWLADHLQDKNLILLHVGEKGEYEKGHIPGAQPIGLSGDVALPFQEGQLSLELLPVDQLKANFEKFGISDDSRIVVYFGNDWASPSTRIIWTLTYMGLGDRTSLLEGGMIAWKAAGLPVTTEVKAPSPGHLTPRVHPEVLVDAAWVSSHLHQPSVALIDVRTPKSYTGESEVRMPRAGHIPGAQNIPIEAMFDAHDNLIDKSAITELFRAAGVKPGSQVVSYCYVGQRATLIWFLARMLGYNASLYDGSWDEWSKRTDLPVETSNSTKQ